jgi:multiple sugar transport system permease protein
LTNTVTQFATPTLNSVGGTPLLKRRKRRSDTRVATLFLLPAGLGFAIFYFYPTIRGLILSFTNTTTLQSGSFVGIANYTKAFNDPLFLNALGVTFLYVVINIVTQTLFALALAFMLHRVAKAAFWKSFVLLPWLVPGVTAALLWMWLLDPSLGLVNGVFESLGWTQLPFFAAPESAIATVALVNTWRYTGYVAILLLAGMESIPADLYEAAALDGAGEGRMFRSITIPLLRPILTLVLIICMVGSVQIFDTIAVATGGGPLNSTNVLYYYIFQKAFTNFDLGYASAMAVVVLAILAVLTLLQFKLSRGNESDLS